MKEAIDLLEKAKKTLHYKSTGSDYIDQALTLLLKQQSAVGEHETRTIENTEVCPCGNIFVEADDYDTLGSKSGVCCPDCGNEKFQTVKSRLDRETFEHLQIQQTTEAQFNAKLDRAEAENKKLKGEEPIPFAWWKDCPKLAQKTMERLIERNEKLIDKIDRAESINKDLVEALKYIQERGITLFHAKDVAKVAIAKAKQ